ncbi:HAD family hydrolase [Streptomyces sp. NPDC001678]|uniref:HAD family hydrolase n=1 Tax=Streptomyces sp. NPDC001678 TaxID=3364599 RepID=UPI0036B9F8DB
MRPLTHVPEQAHDSRPALPSHIHAVVFDIDSVITDLSHAQAVTWTQVLDDYLEAYEPGAGLRGPEPETELPRFLDGTPVVGALTSFLEARGLETGDFGQAMRTAHALAVRQQTLLQRYLHHYGVGIRRGTAALLSDLRRQGIARAAVSGTARARGLLAARGLLPLLDVVLDGDDRVHPHAPARPDPARLYRATGLLGVGLGETAVVDATPDGVEAAARGEFGLVVGLTRAGDLHGMTEMFHRGADVVVHDLGELAAAPRTTTAAVA